MPAEEGVETAELVSFSNADAYLNAQTAFLERCTADALQKLEDSINVYQEQPYLLDPYLEHLVGPPALALQEAVCGRTSGDTGSLKESLEPVCRLLYIYTKIRGHKVICKSLPPHGANAGARFLPHDVSHLMPTLELLELLAREEDGEMRWEVRYVLLLWLSTICLVPFSLDSEESGGSLSSQIAQVSKRFLSSPGKERDAAALLMGHLFRRKEHESARLHSFLDYARARLEAQATTFEATGILQTLCEVVKNGEAGVVMAHLDEIDCVLNDYAKICVKNMLIDRYMTKLVSRLALKMLPTTASVEVDERVDVHVEKLLAALQNPASSVRYSGAKGIARICGRLHRNFRVEIFEAVLAILRINLVDEQVHRVADDPKHFDRALVALDAIDVQAVNEAAWNGVFLTFAECARRSLIPSALLAKVVCWTLRVRGGSYPVLMCRASVSRCSAALAGLGQVFGMPHAT